jgi:hypothetical protein
MNNGCICSSVRSDGCPHRSSDQHLQPLRQSPASCDALRRFLTRSGHSCGHFTASLGQQTATVPGQSFTSRWPLPRRPACKGVASLPLFPDWAHAFLFLPSRVCCSRCNGRQELAERQKRERRTRPAKGCDIPYRIYFADLSGAAAIAAASPSRSSGPCSSLVWAAC